MIFKWIKNLLSHDCDCSEKKINTQSISEMKKHGILVSNEGIQLTDEEIKARAPEGRAFLEAVMDDIKFRNPPRQDRWIDPESSGRKEGDGGGGDPG